MAPRLLRLGIVVLTVCIGAFCGSRRTDAACGNACEAIYYFTKLVADWEDGAHMIDRGPCKNFWITDSPDGPLVSGTASTKITWKITTDDCTLGCQANGGVYGRIYCDAWEFDGENEGTVTCYPNCMTMP